MTPVTLYVFGARDGSKRMRGLGIDISLLNFERAIRCGASELKARGPSAKEDPWRAELAWRETGGAVHAADRRLRFGPGKHTRIQFLDSEGHTG